MSFVFPKGWRLVLTVGTSDFQHDLPGPWPEIYGKPLRGSSVLLHDHPKDRTPERFAGEVTIHTGGAHPSFCCYRSFLPNRRGTSMTIQRREIIARAAAACAVATLQPWQAAYCTTGLAIAHHQVREHRAPGHGAGHLQPDLRGETVQGPERPGHHREPSRRGGKHCVGCRGQGSRGRLHTAVHRVEFLHGQSVDLLQADLRPREGVSARLAVAVAGCLHRRQQRHAVQDGEGARRLRHRAPGQAGLRHQRRGQLPSPDHGVVQPERASADVARAVQRPSDHRRGVGPYPDVCRARCVGHSHDQLGQGARHCFQRSPSPRAVPECAHHLGNLSGRCRGRLARHLGAGRRAERGGSEDSTQRSRGSRRHPTCKS